MECAKFCCLCYTGFCKSLITLCKDVTDVTLTDVVKLQCVGFDSHCFLGVAYCSFNIIVLFGAAVIAVFKCFYVHRCMQIKVKNTWTCSLSWGLQTHIWRKNQKSETCINWRNKGKGWDASRALHNTTLWHKWTPPQPMAQLIWCLATWPSRLAQHHGKPPGCSLPPPPHQAAYLGLPPRWSSGECHLLFRNNTYTRLPQDTHRSSWPWLTRAHTHNYT